MASYNRGSKGLELIIIGISCLKVKRLIQYTLISTKPKTRGLKSLTKGI
jgi:hypothetical protein